LLILLCVHAGEDNVAAVVCDGASVNTSAFNDLREMYPRLVFIWYSLNHSPYHVLPLLPQPDRLNLKPETVSPNISILNLTPQTRCTCHIMNLFLQDVGGHPWVKRVIKEAREIVRFINHHGRSLFLFREACSAFNILIAALEEADRPHTAGALLNPANTRFGTMAAVARSIINARQVFTEMLKQDLGGHASPFRAWSKKLEGDVKGEDGGKVTKKAHAAKILARLESSEWWDGVVEMSTLFDPAVSVLRTCDTSTPTGGRALDEFLALGASLQEQALQKPTERDGLYPFAYKAWVKRWQHFKNPIAGAAHAFDPNNRGMGEHLTNSNKTWIKECISTMVDKKFPQSTEVARQAKRAHVFKQWIQFQGQTGPYKRFKSGGGGEEHEMWAAISQFTAAEWWRRWGPEEHKDLLVALALHVLNQVTNGSATERNWSARKRIHSCLRARLGHECATKELFIMELDRTDALRVERQKEDTRYFRFIDQVSIVVIGDNEDMAVDNLVEDDFSVDPNPGAYGMGGM